jgi:HEAT repeat protein
VGRVLVLILALLAGVGAAFWLSRDAGLRDQVVRVVRNDDRWLDDFQSRNPKEAGAASVELERRGTQALPLIRKTLQDSSAPPARRKAALRAARQLGERAADALPDVTALLHQPDYTPEAALALSFMGSAALNPLRDAIKADDPIVRRESLRSLAKLRERASIDPHLIVPILLTSLKDPDPSVRDIAVTYLGIVRDEPQREVAGLIEALSDEDARVRRAAAVALTAYGAAADAAVPALRTAAKDSDQDVQREAQRALVRIAEIKSKG